MQVIQHIDTVGNVIAARVPGEGTEAIRLGSQLVVEETQQALFFRDGRVYDRFGPGRHTLETANLPLVARLFEIPFDGKSPFQAAVAFVSTRTFQDLRWGTREPVVYRDRELDTVRLRAFGKFALRVVDPQRLVLALLGTRSAYTVTDAESWYRDVIVARLTDTLGETLDSVLDLAERYDELADELARRVAPDFASYGFELAELVLGAIMPPREVVKRMDERAGMAAVGDLEAYTRFKAATALGDAATRGGETGGAVGAGLGVGLGMMASKALGEAAAKGPAGAASSSGAGDPGAAAFCAACGAALPVAARFCASCGVRVAPRGEQ